MAAKLPPEAPIFLLGGVTQSVAQLSMTISLIEQFKRATQPEDRYRYIGYVSQFSNLLPDELLQELSEECLGDQDPRIRGVMCYALGRSSRSSFIPLIQTLFDDPAPWVRGQARKAVRKLEEAVSTQRYLELRDQASKIEEGTFDDTTLRASIEAALRDPDPKVRSEACSVVKAWGAVSKRQAAHFVPLLRLMSKFEDDPSVRQRTASVAQDFAIIRDGTIDLELFAMADVYRKLQILQEVSQRAGDFDTQTLQACLDYAAHDPDLAIRRIALQLSQKRAKTLRPLQEFLIRNASHVRAHLSNLKVRSIALGHGKDHERGLPNQLPSDRVAAPFESRSAQIVPEPIADSPTTKDVLGFRRFTEAIAGKIVCATDASTPVTIGVYGEWGSGKTSFLMMVEERLRGQDIYPVWFNAWKYEQEDNLWSALLQTVLNQATVSGRWYRRAWVKIKIWWDTIDLRAGLWEVAKKIIPAFTRVLLVIASVGIVLGWSQREIQVFLDQVASQVFQNNQAALAFFQLRVVKVIVAVMGFLAAKPSELQKLFDVKLGMDFSKLRVPAKLTSQH